VLEIPAGCLDRQLGVHRRLAVEPHRQARLISPQLGIPTPLTFGNLASDRFPKFVRRCTGIGIGERHREFGHTRVAGRERDVCEVVGPTVDGGGELGVGAVFPFVQGRLGLGSGDVGFDGLCSFA